MKRFIFTTLLIISTGISAFAYGVTGTLSKVGSYNSQNLYILTGNSITIDIRDNLSSYYLVEFTVDGNYFQTAWTVTIHRTATTYWTKNFTFDPSTYFGNTELHSITFYDDAIGGQITIYLYKESQSNIVLCSKVAHTTYLNSSSTQEWEISSDNGISWTTISCTLPFYTESNPIAGTYLYRALNGDGTYSAIKQVTYQDAVPSTLIATPATNSKTVDEAITLSTSATDATYSYQWNQSGTAISGATSATYSIPVIKAAHAGSYTCTVSNGCNSITSAAATLTVNKAAQVITFPDIPIKTYGDATITLPASTDKGLTVFYQSTNTTVATVSGNTVTVVAPGTSNIIASQAGTADYLAATGITKTLTVNKIAQTITLSSTATKTYGDVAFTLPATTDKSKTITYTSSNTAVAIVSGNTVTIKGAGTTDITATQAGDTYYYAAPTATQTLTVNKANQTINFGTFSTKTYGDAATTLPLTTDRGLTISYASNNTAVASVIGNTLTINKVGIATISASQSGNSNYAVASSVSQDITIQKANQTIVWSNIPNKTYGDAAFSLPATTDKGLTISYQSADTNIATVSGNTVTIKAAGTVNITASQSGSENYNAASSVTLPLSVGKATQTITFADLPAYTYGSSPVTLSATSNSGIALTYDSSDPNIASVSGNTLTINNAGQCYITASIVGNANYLTGTPVQKLLTVNKASQIITFDAIMDRTYGDAPFSLSASANSNLPITYSSSSPSELFISGTTATILGAGTFTITAIQAGTSNYNSTTATRTFTVNKTALIVTADNKTRFYGDANPTFTITYSGFVNGDTKYELAAVPVASTIATPTSVVGSYDITLSTITDYNYNLTYRKGTLSINKATLSIAVQNTLKYYGDENPLYIIKTSGFKNSETFNILTTQPAITTIAKTMSNVGVYDIFCSGASATNYEIIYTNAQITIAKALLMISVKPDSIFKGAQIPNFTLIFNGFKGSDDSSFLDVLPTVSCSATSNSIAGIYNVILQGGSDKNYNYILTNGVLVIKDNTGIYNVNDYNTILYPNPVKNKFFVTSDVQINRIEVLSVNGQLIQLDSRKDIKQLDVSGLIRGSYIVKLYSDKAIVTSRFIKE
jgi:hypothetical protein